ncbi:uncharacterized protein LOC144917177 [Branchiostoma floridae x Branchiostoma belcheri]
MAGVRSLFCVVLGFLCALESRGQTGCPDGYVYHQPNRLCYKAFNDTATYNGAVSRCSSDGGVLAMPRDNATNNFLIDLKNAVDINAFFRFGLTDVHQEGVWMWDDNVPLGDFRTWAPGEPNNSGNEDCAEYFSESHSYSNTWNDGPCSRDDRKFICQVSLSGQCWDPGVPANGIRDNNSNFTSGQTVRYTCMDGFQLFGTANITCQPDGTWSGVPPTCGCPTVVLYGGSDTRQVGKMTSYTMTGDTHNDRPVYYSSVNCNYLYYNTPTMEWRVGPPQFDLYDVRVRDSALSADQINGTFRLWDVNLQEEIESPDVKIACSDDVPAGVVVSQSVGGATNCTRVRLHAGADYRHPSMTTYTRTDQTSGGRPVYVSDTDSRDFLYFVERYKDWWVGYTIGERGGFAYVHNCAMTPDQIRSPWKLWDGHQWQVVWSVTASCVRCPTVVLYGGSDTLQAGLMTSYTMRGDTYGDRPVYYSSVTCDYLYYNKPAMGWRVGPEFHISYVYVRDSALYADQINGTFLLRNDGEWIENPNVKIACSDDVPAGVVVSQSVGGATNCARVRLHGGADYRPSRMTTYTRTDQTSGDRPVYVSDTDSRDFLYFVESDKKWWVGATIGESSGFAHVYNCAMTPDQIRSPWYLWDGNQWQVVWSVTASCIGKYRVSYIRH